MKFNPINGLIKNAVRDALGQLKNAVVLFLQKDIDEDGRKDGEQIMANIKQIEEGIEAGQNMAVLLGKYKEHFEPLVGNLIQEKEQ